MSLTIRAAQNYLTQEEALKATKEQKKGDKTNVIFAGNLIQNPGRKTLIEQKRESAHKQARKLLNDAWAKDQKESAGIEDMWKQKEEKLAQIQKYNGIVDDINGDKEALREEYNVAADSEEQQDLELLEKYQDYMKGIGTSEFSEEEVERLKELQTMPRTEYQNKVLALNARAGDVRKNVSAEENQVNALASSITDAKIDQLKNQNMIKAEQNAEKLLDATEKEIFGMLIQEGKEHIDDKMEEEKEKAEEAEEKREEFEERIDEAKERRKEQEEIIEGSAKAEQMDVEATMDAQNSTNVKEAQKQVQKILEENNLINEDLKGIKIDLNF